MSKNAPIWLYDLSVDPFEIYNLFDEPRYASARDFLLSRLLEAMPKYGMTVVDTTNYIYWSTPACQDSKNSIEIDSKYFTCSDIGRDVLPFEKCDEEVLKNHCPVTCQSCCEDSLGSMWVRGHLLFCPQLNFQCGSYKVQRFCPLTCGTCTI